MDPFLGQTRARSAPWAGVAAPEAVAAPGERRPLARVGRGGCSGRRGQGQKGGGEGSGETGRAEDWTRRPIAGLAWLAAGKTTHQTGHHRDRKSVV